MSYKAKIQSIKHLTHDVVRIRAEKPSAITFHSGQAVDISINKPGWEKELRPFTFTSLPEDPFVEFCIKTYPAHKGVTNQLLSLSAGDELLIGEVFGDIHYKGEGIFLAGGAGITPFISILKYLEKKNEIGKNTLIFANKTKADIILENKFSALLGKRFINVLSDEKLAGYEHGFITAEIIKKQIEHPNTYFYLCGPPPMMEAVEKHLSSLDIAKDFIVREAF